MTENNRLLLYSNSQDQAVHSLSEDVQNVYKYEYQRITTFSSWKVDCPVDAARLAKSGFYYSGNGDEVICFSCKGHIKNWNYGDIVQKRHKELFPNCNFVNNRSANIPMNHPNKMNEHCKNATNTAIRPLLIIGRKPQDIDFEKMKSVQERLKTYALNWPLPWISIRNLAEAGFFYLGFDDKVQCPFCKGILGNWKVGDDPFKEHARIFPDCNNLCDIFSNLNLKSDVRTENHFNDLLNRSTPKSVDLDNKSAQKSKDLNNESAQESEDLNNKSALESEDLNNKSAQESEDLNNKSAQESEDLNIKSAYNSEDLDNKSTKNSNDFCDKIIEDIYSLNSDDFCNNGTKKSGELGKEITKKSDSPPKPRLLDKNQEHLNLQKLGVLLHSAPASPHHASFNSRLQSFASWPIASPVSKENLAKAGFFYTGISDHTKCFHCDGGLCNWEFGDDPWIEHARWFRNCDFLHLNKGASFIEDCCASDIDREVDSSSPHILSETLMLNVDFVMESNMVKDVLKTSGFPSYIIRAAVLRQIKETGSSFSTKEDLCQAVTSLKSEMEKQPLLQMENFQSTDLKSNNTIVRKWAAENDGKDMKLTIDSMEISSDGNTKPNVDISDEEASFIKDQYLCIICMEHKVGVVFLPCGHLLACTDCAPALKLCALCRKTIQATVRAYLP